MKTFSIRQLLTNNILIIPEIQREYVWGNNIKVLSSFLSDLNDAQKNISRNIGFLYSYSVHGEEHYIIDGQQRLTTIVLLLFVRSLENDSNYELFKKLLKVDSSTMAFSYNVRPLTEQFLRQLFTHRQTTSKDIQNQKWYFNEYNSDITIQSVLGALDYIAQNAFTNLTFENILDNINFWYFNVNETSQGEELYITMNSRGQKLTQSEQLKPKLFGKLPSEEISKYGKLWDDWEEFFYSHKPENGKLHVMLYVDIAMNNFIRIISELLTCKEFNELQDIPELTLPILSNWFEALERIPNELVFQREINRLFETDEDKNFMVLKSLLVTSMRNPSDVREYTRVHATMRNNVIRRSAVKKHTSLLSLLKLYLDAPQKSFYEFLLSGVDSQDVLASNELSKIEILQNLRLIEIEDTFWKEEHHCIWNGDINPLIEWSKNEDGIFDFKEYKKYENLFNRIFKFTETELHVDKKLDLVRRALLTQKFPNFPGYYRSDTNCSFAYDASDWKKICQHSKEMKEFLDQLLSIDSWDSKLIQMINEYQEGGEYFEFVHDERLLAYCLHKNIQWWWNNIILIHKERASGAHANIHAFKYYKLNEKKQFTNWIINFYELGKTCTYFNQIKENKRIAIDLNWNSGKEHNLMKITCFMRNEKDSNIAERYLLPITEKLDYKWNGERYYLYINTPQDEKESFALMDENLKSLMQTIADLAL